MSYAILEFPHLTDFIAELKKRKLHRYGLIAHENISTGSHAIPQVKVTARLTAKDPKLKEILRCSLLLYHGLYTTAKQLREDMKEPKEKMLGYINKTFKNECKDHKLERVTAEFRVK